MKKLLLKLSASFLVLTGSLIAQVLPVANFSFSPNPVCTGSSNVLQITDNSSNAPTSWSYTVQGNPGPGGGAPVILTSQNPTVTFNGQGTYTITLIAANSAGSSSAVSYTLLVLPSPNANINPATQTTCIGSVPINFSVTAGGGPGGGGVNTYSWSTGSTASLISVSPSVTTGYTCIITATNGCSIERSATLTIGTPTVTINSNPVNICPGTSSTLNATGTAPGPFSYIWSNSITTRTISTNVAGVYDVTVTNSNGCISTQSYTLGTSTTLSLTAVSNPSILCAGNTATVRVTGAGTYTWSNGATTPNASVNPNSTTTYTVLGQIGVCSGTTSITLSVNVTPTILVSSSSSSLCAGTSATLNASGASTYTWLPSTVSESISVSPNTSTTYTVRGNNPGCPNRTGTISITVAPSPTITVVSNFSIVCAGELVAMAASGANSFTWNSGSTGAIQLVNPTVTTTYTVTGSALNGCRASASIVQNVNACTKLSSFSNEVIGINVFPNPSSDQVSISSDLVMEISIVSQTGVVVKHFYLNDSNNKSVQVNDLTNGVYFIVAKNSEISLNRKLIIMK